MIKILTSTDIDCNKWNNLIKESANATFFQTPECYNFYKTLNCLNPFLFGLEINSELKAVVCGYILSEKGILKSFFSRRAIVPGGILLANDILKSDLQYFLQFLKIELKEKCIYLEIRNLNSYSDNLETFKKAGFLYHKHLNFHLDITNSEVVENNLSNNIKRQIKHTIKNNVTCNLSTNENDIEDFYRILSDLYKIKVKTPLFPVEFFKKVVKLTNATLFIVKYKNEIVGGILCVYLDKKTVYEWYICGKELSKNNIYPSAYATWCAIQNGIEKGFDRFDFMGAGKPEEKYGVRDFKAKFGGQLVENGRFILINNYFLYHLGAKFINIKKSLLF